MKCTTRTLYHRHFAPNLEKTVARILIRRCFSNIPLILKLYCYRGIWRGLTTLSIHTLLIIPLYIWIFYNYVYSLIDMYSYIRTVQMQVMQMSWREREMGGDVWWLIHGNNILGFFFFFDIWNTFSCDTYVLTRKGVGMRVRAILLTMMLYVP